jgi:hypothetical protein
MPNSIIRHDGSITALKDGRSIATLGHAREMMFPLPSTSRRGTTWRSAASLLSDAAIEGRPTYGPTLCGIQKCN